MIREGMSTDERWLYVFWNGRKKENFLNFSRNIMKNDKKSDIIYSVSK